MPEVETILENFGRTIVDALGRNLAESKDATSELRNSFRFDVKRFGLSYSFKLYLADYYKWVDEGRRPGGKQPPPEALIKWIKDKRLVFASDGRLDTAKQGEKRKSVAESTRIKSLAFLMGRKIAREGIPPTNFYTNSVTPEIIDKLKKDIKAAIGKQVMIDIKSAFND